MSQAEYARRRAISRQRVHDLVRQKRIAIDVDGLIDVEASDAILETTLDQSKAHRARQTSIIYRRSSRVNGDKDEDDGVLQNSPDDYWEHKARRERIEADRAELALAKQRGELADVNEVRRLQRDVYSKVATSLIQIPARIAPVCVALDAVAMEKAIHDEIERVLLSVAQQLEAGA